ncbi:spirocyclase AveC family protein [Streptomyces cyaneus]|uniref:spirocyclase AveC family protein n=1 Tax=Streptomyces cyaneus TaxID=1904 RepID=UPI0013E2EF40|nr:spirocyclase AveC family protein [Streptomyces cyaneus]
MIHHHTSLWRQPNIYWALLGLLYVGFSMVVYGRWIIDGGVHSVGSGDYGTSATRRLLLWVWQGVVVALTAALAVYLVRRYRAARQITLSGAMFASGLLSLWVTPLYQYDGYVFGLSRVTVNVSSWGPWIPGWHGDNPESQFITPLSADGLPYTLMASWILVSRWLLDRVCSPRKNWRRTTLLVATLAVCMAASCLFEQLWILTGSYAYVSASPGPALFAGHWYQLPLLEVFLLGMWTATFVFMDRLARDRGTPFPLFRGSEHLSGWQQPVARILAVNALFTTLTLLWTLVALPAFSASPSQLNPDLPLHLTPGDVSLD